MDWPWPCQELEPSPGKRSGETDTRRFSAQMTAVQVKHCGRCSEAQGLPSNGNGRPFGPWTETLVCLCRTWQLSPNIITAYQLLAVYVADCA